MNYLGHFLLSHATADAITGAMLGDFVKGEVDEAWGPEIRAAILLHRDIDRYTDRHPLVAASRTLISPERRRFAGIMLDIFYDHFLARHWRLYYGGPLPDFARMIYGVLLSRQAMFPERLQRIVPFMAANDWLASYAEVAAVDAALKGIARRFRYPQRAQALLTGVAELEQNYPELEQRFAEFFPELRIYAAAQWAMYADAATPTRQPISRRQF